MTYLSKIKETSKVQIINIRLFKIIVIKTINVIYMLLIHTNNVITIITTDNIMELIIIIIVIKIAIVILKFRDN